MYDKTIRSYTWHFQADLMVLKIMLTFLLKYNKIWFLYVV